MAAGFQFSNVNDSKDFAMTVADDLDYEISFWFKQPTRQPTFEVSVKCFDCDLVTEKRPIDILSGAFNNVLIPGNLQICSLEDKWNFFHGVLYGKNQQIVPDDQPLTSHAAGTNLIMSPGTAKLFVNFICVQNCVLIVDFKVKPLRTPFSIGFIQGKGLLEIWRKNNKKDMTQEQIDVLARQFLLPHNMGNSVINL